MRLLLTVTLGAVCTVAGCVVPPQGAAPPPAPPPVPSVAEHSRNRDFVNLPAGHLKTFSIRANQGKLGVQGTDEKLLTVRTLIFARAESPAEAERINREITVRLESRETENPSLIIGDPHLRDGQMYEVDVIVEVPRDVRISIVDGGGPIEVQGLSDGVEIENEQGPVTVIDVRGGVTLDNRGGPCAITGASGKIDVTDGAADLTIEQIDGEVDVRDPSGKLAIRHVTGTVLARGNKDGIELINIDGEAILFGIPAEKSPILKGVRNLSFKEGLE